MIQKECSKRHNAGAATAAIDKARKRRHDDAIVPERSGRPIPHGLVLAAETSFSDLDVQNPPRCTRVFCAFFARTSESVYTSVGNQIGERTGLAAFDAD